ncbi:MAG: DUF2029 domain-containing protein, partial [Patescibacteria group bacterium]|nr:DUF2029 domain-containing protein [Patescibacteria group bacterium]
PSTLFFLYPILIFNFTDSSRIWLIFSIVSLLGSFYLLYKIKKTSVFVLSLISLAVALSFPFKFTLGMGQINFFILLLLAYFLYLFKKGKLGWAGIFLSLATLIKIFPAIFLFIPIFLRKWKTIIWFLIILFSILIFIKGELVIYYFRGIFIPLFINPYGGVYYNQSITGFMSRINAPDFLIIIFRMIIFIYSIYFIFKNKNNLLLSFSVLLVSVLMINNFTWQHHLIFLLIPYYFLVSGRQSTFISCFLVISYFLVAVNIKNPSVYQYTLYGNLLLSHGFFGVLILWILMIVRGNKIIKIK